MTAISPESVGRKSVLYFSTASTTQLSALSQSLFPWSHLLSFLSLLLLSLPFLYKANCNDILGPLGNPRYNLPFPRCLNISGKETFYSMEKMAVLFTIVKPKCSSVGE